MASKKQGTADIKDVLNKLGDHLTPELISEIKGQLGGEDELVADNQNQNQGAVEEFAKLKPDVLREIVAPDIAGDEELMDNQNQNQGAVADMLKLKPGVLRQMRANLGSGDEELMDNQNQNQQQEHLSAGKKPPR